MADQIYKVRDPTGAIREIKGPEGASDDEVIAQAQKLLAVTNTPVSKEVSTVDRLRAGAGGINRGVAGIAGLPMDTVENVYNLGKAGVGTLATMAGRPDLAPELTRGTPLSSEWFSGLLNKAGIGTGNPNPEDPASQALHTGGMILGGSAFPQSGTVGQSAVQTLKTAIPAALGGAAAGQIDPRLTGLGAMVPATAGQVGRDVKQHFAGNAPANVNTFEKAGVAPSAGQATESGFFRGLENLISKFPGGTGIMRRFSENQQRTLGEGVQRGTANAETAGRAIEQGVRGEGGFLARFRQTQDQLYGELDKHIPLDTRIDVSRTRNALEDLNAAIPGAPELSKQFQNARIGRIESALKSDLQGTAGTKSALPAWEQNKLEQVPKAQSFAELAAANDNKLPYEAIRKLRTLVGREISDATIASDVPRSKWKALYAALSDDLGAAAKQAGPQAEGVWSRANNYSRAGMGRIESVLDKAIGKDRLPEDIFRAVNPTNPDQANRIRSVMRSMQPEERQIVSDAIINRMGRSTPGRQNEAGDVWSSETFLTNWNKLSPGAKSQIMPTAQLRADLDAVASVASNIREGSKVFANPSGTAGAVAPYGLSIMAVTGGVVPAGAVVLGANMGARLLTSPRFVNWLATASKADSAAMPTHLVRLGTIFNNEKDQDIKAELSQYINSIK